MGRSADVLSELWQELVASLESTLSRAALNRWLKHITPLSLDDDCLRVGVPSAFARDWVERKAADHLRTEASRILGRPVLIRLVVQQLDLGLSEEREPAPPAVQRSPGNHPRRSDDFAPTPLVPRYTFDNFVVGRSNQFAQAAAVAVANTPARAYNPLFIYGGVGLGKTHLMHAIGHQVLATHPDLNVAYVTGDTFTYHVVTSIREDRFGTFRSRYRDVDLWLVDDIQFIAAKERTEAEFFQTFNALYETERQVVITSDRPPKDLALLEKRLRSRFGAGVIVDIQAPDQETRVAILRRELKGRPSVEFPDSSLRLIADRISSNVRELKGALNQVIAVSDLTSEPIGDEMAAQVLDGLLEKV